ncbi:FtsW/RodA/SpoVE family cell cycle protein [Nesterenkonia flava]|uniref:peptidoglycan glycosyltransferase n=1 Tax=Nesterenkonia flava TaxID=469799 RepID=A0ABU1FXL5_9MICC|nr:FtsW/RodA/SpoVE family cell cycle protein [Nesterenkonia flava]MDR5712893.1 FtsW/RodA/SpoVE family cell cycle protein [Nesterenkonia flava]
MSETQTAHQAPQSQGSRHGSHGHQGDHPKPRRNVELVLLLMALTIGIGAQVLVGLTLDEEIGTAYWTEGAIQAGLALGFHVVLRLRAKYADPFILPIVVTLNGLGIAMIHRLDFTSAYSGVADRQLMWTALSMVVAVVVLWVLQDHRRLRQFTYLSLVASIVLLLLPIVPGLGDEVYGANVWVSIGGMSFQPGELAKITLAIFFAGFLANNRDLILLAGKKIGPLTFPRVRDLAPLFIAWLVALGVLIVQNDLGNALMFFGLFVAVIYVATSRFSWIAIGGVFVTIGAFLAYHLVWHFRQRVEIWLNAFDQEVYERVGGSHQIVQGMFGLAHGGLTGTGLGHGTPQMVALANSDMIIAAFGEELGFIGLSAMLLLYLILFSRYMRAAIGTRDHFGKLLASGLAVVLVLQVFVVVGGITRVIPMSGLVSPFLSAGGSALLANWIIVAIVLLISHAARRPIVVGPMVNTSGEGASGTEDRLHRDRRSARPETPAEQTQHFAPPSSPARPLRRGGEHQ